MIYNLVPETDPILKQQLDQFDFQNPPINPQILVKNLLETMDFHHGIGLSANQVGLPFRVFVMRSYPNEPPLIVFNPKIVNFSPEECFFDEGCLTYPELFIKIRRSIKIRARFQDFMGQIKTENIEGIHARIFQHEYDHLNGNNFFDKANFLNHAKALKTWGKLKKQRQKNVKQTSKTVSKQIKIEI